MQSISSDFRSNVFRLLPQLIILLVSLQLVGLGHADDWPQILGPQRNGIAENEPPIEIWADGGPQVLWKQQIGQGYAGPAVVDQRVFLFHRVNDLERIEAFDAKTGKSEWQTDFKASYSGGVNPDNGPRCVPLVHGSYVYVFGAAGDLHCVELGTGKKVWTRNTYQEFGGREGYFGAGSTPIVADGKLIVNVGGKDAGLVAFDLKNGKTIWKSTTEGASYSSPTQANINGKQHVLFVTRMNAVSINPANGDVRFRFPFGMRGPTVNGATPLIIGDRLFVSSSYRVGAKLAKITESAAAQIWANDTVMSSHYATCVHRSGFLFGTHGREDFNNCEYRCIELESGKIKWQKSIAHTHSILIGDQLLLLGVDGMLRLAKANPQEYEELASAQVSRNVTRSLPALSNGNLYFRDNTGKSGTLSCLELGKQE